MKKLFIIFLFSITFAFTLIAQSIDPDESESSEDDTILFLDDEDLKNEIIKLKKEINAIKKDIEMLKKRTEWFSFRIEGSVKTTYGVNILTKEKFGDNDDPSYGFDSNAPITHGFDFENKIKLYMNLGNKVIASSTKTGDYGTKIIISLKIESLGVSKIKPEGSWYIVKGEDDQGNDTDIYFPRYEAGGSNIVFGQFQIALKEAIVKDIVGSGFFVSYKDVQEVHQYYNVGGLVDIIVLNHKYFNNGFVVDRGYYDDDHKGDCTYASLFYSFDNEDYEPESEVAEAMKLWSNAMLHYNPDNDDYNQKPHGISFGFDKSLSEGFDIFIEGGVSTKDAFDPKYYTDDNIDFGFFVKAEPKLHNNKFEFNPKVAASFAFQTETTDDHSWQWSSFGAGVSLPVSFFLPTGKDDKITMDLSWNINANIVSQYLATMLSFTPSFNLLNSKLTISTPVIYSFKNADRGGFLRMGHPDVKWIDQLYDDHVLNIGIKLGFDSRNLFGDLFQYKVTNDTYITVIKNMQPQFYLFLDEELPLELYFFNIHKHEFTFNEFGPEKLSVFFEFGLGYTRNAKLIDSETQLKYEYNRDRDVYVDTLDGERMKWHVWHSGLVLSFSGGIKIEIIKNFLVGLDIESPKICVNEQYHPLGNQRSFSVFKLWSEIKF